MKILIQAEKNKGNFIGITNKDGKPTDETWYKEIDIDEFLSGEFEKLAEWLHNTANERSYLHSDDIEYYIKSKLKYHEKGTAYNNNIVLHIFYSNCGH